MSCIQFFIVMLSNACLLVEKWLFSLVLQGLLGRGSGLSFGAAEETAPLYHRKWPRSCGGNGRPQLQDLQDWCLHWLVIMTMADCSEHDCMHVHFLQFIYSSSSQASSVAYMLQPDLSTSIQEQERITAKVNYCHFKCRGLRIGVDYSRRSDNTIYDCFQPAFTER